MPMTKAQFKKIVDRIGDAYKDPFTESQFEEWYLHFKDDDFKVVNDAVTRMTEEYKYFPMIPTLKAYVKDQAKIEEDKVKPQIVKPKITAKDIDRHKRWMRFCFWIWDMCRQGKRTWKHPRTTEEVYKLRDYFEKNFPNYKELQIKKRSGSFVDVLGGVFDNMKKSENNCK